MVKNLVYHRDFKMVTGTFCCPSRLSAEIGDGKLVNPRRLDEKRVCGGKIVEVG